MWPRVDHFFQTVRNSSSFITDFTQGKRILNYMHEKKGSLTSMCVFLADRLVVWPSVTIFFRSIFSPGYWSFYPGTHRIGEDILLLCGL